MITRRRWAPRMLALLALLATGALGVPAVSAGNPCFHDFTMPPAETSTGPQIKLLPCAFAPTVTQVAIGAEVTFYNGPEFSHLITGANQEWGSPDVELAPGKTVSYTFDKAGIYPFACVLHPGMSGAIVVGDVADVLAAGSTSQSGAGGSTTAASGVNDTAPVDATASTARTSTFETLPIVFGIGAGVVVGAAAVWLALRHRQVGHRDLVRAE
jgi:plastocyanin